MRGDHTWEIDEFYGDNRGLLVAEVELGSADEAFEQPEWLGQKCHMTLVITMRLCKPSLHRLGG